MEADLEGRSQKPEVMLDLCCLRRPIAGREARERYKTSTHTQISGPYDQGDSGGMNEKLPMTSDSPE